MTTTTPISLEVSDCPERRGSRYPAPFNEPCLARSNRNLGDPFGLKDFGVHVLTLEPGVWSSQRHWHTHEDELVYVLEGTPTLVTDEGETQLAPGCVAGFAAGTGNGHHLVNKSAAPAKLIVVGSRKSDDDVYYSDIDMQIAHRGDGGVFSRKSGQPY
jgi:uncharacterized cupin superfamily protein